MIFLPSAWTRVAFIAAVGLLCLSMRQDALPAARLGLADRMRELPKRTLWAWERPEDLHSVDARNVAIASLDQTILLGPGVVSEPRRQPLIYPNGAVRIAVVRIEALPGAKLDDVQRRDAVALLLHSAKEPGIAALQVDFDARLSQREFYRNLLWDLRRQMPTGLPLSITALASWCSYDDWLGGLPVDEAVPMLFRMEPDRRHAAPDRPQFRIRERLCMGSVGISTHEDWPEEMTGKRIYIFADRGWRKDLSVLAERKLP